jgi:hypothetical protein
LTLWRTGIVLAGGLAGLLHPTQLARVPASLASATVAAPPPSVARELVRARAIVARAKAAKKMASDALDVDGTAAAARAFDEVLACRTSKQECTALALSMSDPNSRVGALVARASRAANQVLQPNLLAASIVSLEPDVAEAELYARQARDQAKKNAADRAEHDKKMSAEAQSIAAATVACGSSETACKARCDKGEGPMCLAFAVRLRNATPPKLDDARRYMAKACDLQLEHACAEIGGIGEQIKRDAETNRAWTDVQALGDELAQETYEYAFDLLGIVTERYCPAKGDFLARASEAEFAKRAAEHCTESPPTGLSIEGVTVTLPEQCKAAFATPCPEP